MIDLDALREQLRLLGHDLPDSQIVGILKEMNIDFNDLEDGNTEGRAAAAPQRTGSILDSFHGKQTSHPHAKDTDAAGSPTQPLQTFQYDYTSPSAPGYTGGHSRTTIQADAGVRPQQNFYRDAGDTYYESDDDAKLEEPGLSCRFCTDGKGPGHTDTCKAGVVSAASHAWAEATSPPGRALGAAAYAQATSRQKQDPGGLVNDFGRMSTKQPTAAPTCSPCAAYMADRKQGGRAGLPAGRTVTRPASAGQKSQRMQAPVDQSKASAMYRLQQDDVDDDESDVAVSDPDKSPGPLGPGASRQGLASMPPHRDWQGQQQSRLGKTAAAGRDVSLNVGHGEPYGGWFEEGPQHTRDVGDPISPQASDRSLISRASTRTSMGCRGRTTKKVDRVQRYQELQREWSQNRFLKQANGTARGTSRKPVNFHNHFASLHAAEEAERQRMLRETRARTKKVLGAATEAPTANRRDELRWQTRMRLKEQS